MFLSNPPKPKYICTWDVNKVLEYLKFLHPLQNLSIEELTLKTSTLIALTTAQRVQTFISLDVDYLSDYGDFIVF
jgi:hypothetical protein